MLDTTETLARENGWGSEDRYYAQQHYRQASSSLFPGSEKRWAAALESSTPGVKERVRRIVNQWNKIIRDYLRAETALRLTVGESIKSAPVRVLDGMPKPFAQVMRDFEGLEWLILNRPLLETTAQGVRFIEEHTLEQFGVTQKLNSDGGGFATAEELRNVHRAIQALLEALGKGRPLERIRGINQDVLGAYFFRKPEVHIYWLVIGIVAAAIGVQPEPLAVVVLTHELAHAYTHLGKDIDNEEWNTEAFAKADLPIVEGLAQFYTATVCRRLETRFPAALAAYEALLGLQSGPYLAHQAWLDEGEHGGEIVRVAMIECRSRRMTKATDFVAAIEHHREQVRGRKSKAETHSVAPVA